MHLIDEVSNTMHLIMQSVPECKINAQARNIIDINLQYLYTCIWIYLSVYRIKKKINSPHMHACSGLTQSETNKLDPSGKILMF